VSVCSLSVTDKNLNFSAVRSPIELKLGGDLWFVSQISVHALVSRLSFVYIFQTNKTETRRNRENHGFTKLAFLCRAESD
jgi:uncharacterized membrane protein